MPAAYHVVMCMYGYWLPNDPRGSWSDFVRNLKVLRFGDATKTDARVSVADQAHDSKLRRDAKSALEFPEVTLDNMQIETVGKGFGRASMEGDYTIFACSIMPEHTHIVIGRHERPIGQIVGHLKSRATTLLRSGNNWYGDKRPVWARKYWKVFLDTKDDIERAIEYTNANVRTVQKWSFITDYPMC